LAPGHSEIINYCLYLLAYLHNTQTFSSCLIHMSTAKPAS